MNERLRLATNLVDWLNQCPDDLALPIVDEYLSQSATHGPIASFDDIASDARFWASIATPVELRSYFAATLYQLGPKTFGLNARKRLLVMLWGGLPEVDRAAFLARVDQNGQFRRAA